MIELIYSLKTCKHISEEFTHRFHVAENSMVRAKKKLSRYNYIIFSKSSMFLLISNFAVLFVFFRTTVRLMDQHTFHLHLIQYGKGKALYEFPSLFLTTFPVNGLIDLVNVWIYTIVKWYFQGSPSFNISEDLILLAPVLQ